jgi:hypothetical protein
MQQYITYGGTVLAGRAALFDTMKDLVVDILGAIFSCTIGFLTLRKREKDEITNDDVTEHPPAVFSKSDIGL